MDFCPYNTPLYSDKIPKNSYLHQNHIRLPKMSQETKNVWPEMEESCPEPGKQGQISIKPGRLRRIYSPTRQNFGPAP